MMFVIALVIIASVNIFSVSGNDHEVNPKFPDCKCTKAPFAELPKGETDVEKYVEKLDKGKPEGQQNGFRFHNAMHLVDLCGNELNKINGNKGCPENSIVKCNKYPENPEPHIYDPEGFPQSCTGKTKCKPAPYDKQWTRVCQ